MIDDSDEMVLRFLGRGPARSTDVAAALKISRQAAHARLSGLVDAGLVVREGAARATRYRLAERPGWQRVFPLAGLAEDEVFRQLASEVEAIGSLEGEAAEVVSYVVTELVNNAIDHSAGEQVRLVVAQRGSTITLEVEDDGVGVFAHVRRHFDLPSDIAAVQELSKGKTTTAPDRHTGEGLFFVSKCVDWFRLESGGLAWLVDNERDDMAIEEIGVPRRGTLAVGVVDLHAVRPLGALFDEFTDNYEFSKTRTVIRLFEIGVRFVSRSEAKRLLHGLDRFGEVVLDFRGVQGIGQGFADEVFRVWSTDHPEVSLVPVHMNGAVEFMVERARRRKSSA